MRTVRNFAFLIMICSLVLSSIGASAFQISCSEDATSSAPYSFYWGTFYGICNRSCDEMMGTQCANYCNSHQLPVHESSYCYEIAGSSTGNCFCGGDPDNR